MDRNNMELYTRQDSLCKNPQERLLAAVRSNDENTIRSLIRSNKELVNEPIGDDPKPILYIALVNFAETTTAETVETLIELGADLHYKVENDGYKEALHYAALSENPSLLKAIISRIGRDKINATTHGSTALNLLIKEGDAKSANFDKCLSILLNNGIDVNIADNKNQTPIFVAARKKYKNVVGTLLNSGKYVDVDGKVGGQTARGIIKKFQLYDGDLSNFNNNNDRLSNNRSVKDLLIGFIRTIDEDGFLNCPVNSNNVDDSIEDGTLLQLACDRNLQRIVKYLLENKADVYKTTRKNKKQPLEIAAENGYWKIFETLLPHYTKIPDNLLSVLLKNVISDNTKEIDYKKCLKSLLEQENLELAVNKEYINGNTPLHFSARYADSETTLNLLKRGASLANKDKYFESLPVEDMNPKTLEKHLDDCVTIKCVPSLDKISTVVTFDYKTLMPTNSTIPPPNQIDVENTDYLVTNYRKPRMTKETDVVLKMSEKAELRPLLNHPLITSFLYIKWHKIRWFFYWNLILYLAFILSLAFHIFLKDGKIKTVFTVLLIVTYLILIIREFAQMIISPKSYFGSINKFSVNVENLLELALIIVTGYILFENDKNKETEKQLSAIAILLASLELMLLIGQHPRLSTNIVIFRTVTLNFFKFILWYAILIIAFVASFYKLFNNQDEGNNQANMTILEENKDQDFFNEPTLTFIKTIVMLTGEFDASSLNLTSPSNKLLFLVFVFLIPIILLNLLNGLAVSDIQEIKSNAETVGYVERINHIAYIENIFFGNLLPVSVLNLFTRCAGCFRNNYKSTISSTPKWMGKYICIFPDDYKDYKMRMYLYQGGKIFFEDTKIDIEADDGCYKRCKEVRVDKKTIKRVKQMLCERNDDLIGNESNDELRKEIRALRELFKETTDGLREQIRVLQENVR